MLESARVLLAELVCVCKVPAKNLLRIYGVLLLSLSASVGGFANYFGVSVSIGLGVFLL